jgi:hypothetical protein
MIKKIAPEMTLLVHKGRTNMTNLINYIGETPKRLVKEVVDSGLHPSGPQYWIYEDAAGDPSNPDTEFTLKICLPVATFGNTYTNGEFTLEKAPAFNCVSCEHIGDWKNLGATYMKMMEYIQKEGLTPNGTSREVYINCDFENPANNITEVQLGIL